MFFFFKNNICIRNFRGLSFAKGRKMRRFAKYLDDKHLDFSREVIENENKIDLRSEAQKLIPKTLLSKALNSRKKIIKTLPHFDSNSLTRKILSKSIKKKVNFKLKEEEKKIKKNLEEKLFLLI